MAYTLLAGIHHPPVPVSHRNEDYDESGFATLLNMQQRHFWYRGRHRFLLEACKPVLFRQDASPGTRSLPAVIDFGGGVGGWVRHLEQHGQSQFSHLALADSSLQALTMAGEVLSPTTERYHVDLMNLCMHDQWDAAFLLDVLEHVHEDAHVLRQIKEALKPGGHLFVTTPALQQFWSYNDAFWNHKRRYCRADFRQLAHATGLTLCDARYFMFFLSPLYLFSRLRPGARPLDERERRRRILRQHRIPSAPVNALLSAVFAAETPLGHWLRFPWGTSILGVFQKV
ncbi:MAG: class I SAM-dependent methyltransferase [Magnetococcales bacterium]|nr:class I SAM-dependent methyltransferase [Magnetococcales bacterium]